MRLLRARGGTRKDSLCLSYAGPFQVIGKDQSQFPGRAAVGEVRRGERASYRTKKYTDLGFDLGERKEQVVCHASALAIADEARRESEM